MDDLHALHLLHASENDTLQAELTAATASARASRSAVRSKDVAAARDVTATVLGEVVRGWGGERGCKPCSQPSQIGGFNKPTPLRHRPPLPVNTFDAATRSEVGSSGLHLDAPLGTSRDESRSQAAVEIQLLKAAVASRDDACRMLQERLSLSEQDLARATVKLAACERELEARSRLNDAYVRDVGQLRQLYEERLSTVQNLLQLEQHSTATLKQQLQLLSVELHSHIAAEAGWEQKYKVQAGHCRRRGPSHLVSPLCCVCSSRRVSLGTCNSRARPSYRGVVHGCTDGVPRVISSPLLAARGSRGRCPGRGRRVQAGGVLTSLSLRCPACWAPKTTASTARWLASSRRLTTRPVVEGSVSLAAPCAHCTAGTYSRLFGAARWLWLHADGGAWFLHAMAVRL